MKRDRELVGKIYEVFPEVYQRGCILCNMFNAPFGILREEELLANYTYSTRLGYLANLPIWGPLQDQLPSNTTGSVSMQKVYLALANKLCQVIEGTELKQVWDEWRIGDVNVLDTGNAALFLAFITRFCERGGIILGKDMRRHGILYMPQRYYSLDYSEYNLDLAVSTRAYRTLASHRAIDLLCAISPSGAENLIAKGKWHACFVTGKPISPEDYTVCYLMTGQREPQRQARRDEFIERYIDTGQYFFDCIAEVYYNLDVFERVWLEDREGCAWEGNAYWHEDNEGWYSYEQERNDEDDDYEYPGSPAVGGYHGTRRDTREVRAYQLGIENEVKFDSYTSRRDAVKKIKALGGLLCERDGSLCDETGVEIVQLKPASLEDTKSLWTEALKVIPPQKYAGYGMHINICTSDWSEDQLANFVGFWSINDDFVRYLSRRDYGYYCNQAAPHSVYIKDKLANSYAKYRACAVFPDQMRAEVRIFRGTHIHELLCARAELVDAVARWSAGIPTTADAVSYINGAGESLLEYMKQDEGKYGAAIKAVRNWVRLRTRQDKCTKTGTSDAVKALINKPEPPPPAPAPPPQSPGEIPVDRPSEDPCCAANIYNRVYSPPSVMHNDYWITPDDGMAWPGVPEINEQAYMLCGNYAAYFDTYICGSETGERHIHVERAYGVVNNASRPPRCGHRIALDMVPSPGRWEDSGQRYNGNRLYVWVPDQPAQPVLVEASDYEWDPFAEDES